jgi:preprotein translocase subunit SecF
MFDGFWSGIFGGLFGRAIAQWMSRFKYWVIFSVAMVTVHVVAFIHDWLKVGIDLAIKRTIEFTFTPVGILAPMGIGLLAVFVAIIGSLNTPSNDN